MKTRRDFLKTCAALSLAAQASAQTSADYKALVCVFMFGGNDGNNVIVPMETTEYGQYTRGRAQLALSLQDLLPISGQGKAYGLHPSLTGVRTLYQRGRAAIIANTGTLVQPLTRQQFLDERAVTPRNLFSHSDQTSEWQSGNPQGGAGTGWAGRIIDSIGVDPGASLPPSISVAGNALLLAGLKSTAANLTPGNEFGLDTFGGGDDDTARLEAFMQILNQQGQSKLAAPFTRLLTDGLNNAREVRKILDGAPDLATAFPDTELGRQLQQVAKLISVRARLGASASRQVYFCSLGGFDHHSDLLNSQANLLNQVDAALSAFQLATDELGVANSVTTFTASEFSRTFAANSTNGSDHAWGSNHLILGGAVKGGQIYGRFPLLEPNGTDDAADRGQWIPSTSLDQYAGTLATWFGVPASAMLDVFPNRANFAAGGLGFV